MISRAETVFDPTNARPCCGRKLMSINPVDKKKKRVGMSSVERSAFGYVCRLGSDQIIECYGNKDYCDREYSPYDFMAMCSECQYADRWRYTYSYLAPAKTLFDAHTILTVFDEYIDFESPKAFVYFVGDGTAVKIGVAADPQKRLCGLQTGNPRKCRIMYLIPCKSQDAAYMVEKKLHYYFQDYGLAGEWFDIYKNLESNLSFARLFNPCDQNIYCEEGQT